MGISIRVNKILCEQFETRNFAPRIELKRKPFRVDVYYNFIFTNRIVNFINAQSM